jgi:hypothetical protein
MMFLFDLGGIAILLLGVFVGTKLDKWFGSNHRHLHAIYRHLGVTSYEDAIAKINEK